MSLPALQTVGGAIYLRVRIVWKRGEELQWDERGCIDGYLFAGCTQCARALLCTQRHGAGVLYLVTILHSTLHVESASYTESYTESYTASYC